MKAEGMKVRVAEKGGRQVKQMLQKSDIDGSKFCSDESCVVCKTSTRGSCWKESVCYTITCMECASSGINAKMFGETGKTAKIRCGQHMTAYQKRCSFQV